jgi:pimeloyl-ACP methyl ester carboxylesterase
VLTRAAAMLVLLAACAGSRGRIEADLVSSHYSPLSRTAEVARRALPPLTHRRIHQVLAGRKQGLTAQAIDLAKEKFDLYVPPGPAPPRGYGLLVFIAPWSDPTRPRLLRPPLDRHHLLFVSAQDSGNDRPILDRRLPLALLAYQAVRARFPLDPERVYVMGFSGGSRVAEIAALAYPDVFRGAILNAGADPIDGQDGIYKPPADLFRRFQRSRLVYVTGDRDEANLRQDEVSRASMRQACVLDVKTAYAFRLGHELVDRSAFDRALDLLTQPRAVDEAELARCNARIEREIAAAVREVEAALRRGDRAGARRLLKAIDARFGGLAARALLALDARLAPG